MRFFRSSLKEWPEFQGLVGCTFPGQPMIRRVLLKIKNCEGIFFGLRRLLPEPREDLGRYMARTEGRQDSQADMEHKKRQRSSRSKIWRQVSHLGSVENLEKVQSIRDQSASGGCSSSDWSFEEAKVDKPRPKMVLVQPPSPSLALLSAR